MDVGTHMRRTLALIAAATLVLALAGCGSSSSDAKSSDTTAAGSTAKTTVASDDGYGKGGDTDTSTTEADSGDSSGDAATAALIKKAGLTGKVNLADEKDEQIATVSSTDVDIELSDFYFGPTFINAKAGSTLHATLTNKGTMPHTFTIDSLKIDEVLQPGDTATVDITVPAASSSLAVYCKYHKGGGMQGAIFGTN